MQPTRPVDRREFLTRGAVAGSAAVVGSIAAAGRGGAVLEPGGKKVRVGVIGCGSVSRHVPAAPVGLPVRRTGEHLRHHPRAGRGRAAAKFKVPNHYPHIDAMLAGAPFDLLVDLTDMQEHERLNRGASRPASTSGARSRWRTR